MARWGEGTRSIAFSCWAAIELEDLDECSTASRNDIVYKQESGPPLRTSDADMSDLICAQKYISLENTSPCTGSLADT